MREMCLVYNIYKQKSLKCDKRVIYKDRICIRIFINSFKCYNMERSD